MIDLTDTTLGCELEIGDVDTKIKIPKELGQWDYHDSSIMNSNGTANDPKRILNRYGGEIQVRPTHGTLKLVERVEKIYDLFPRVDFNFTTNLHVHIRVPGLIDDLDSLKKIATYLKKYGKEMFNIIDPIPWPNKPESKGAMARYTRRKRSHHTLPSDRVYTRMMAAKAPEEFHIAHAPLDKNGKPQWHLVQRAGVNLAHLWKNDCIEFRCFTMTDTRRYLLNAFEWPRLFLRAALETGEEPGEQVENYDLKFQFFWPYDEELDRIFQLTNVRHNKRSVAEANYEKLIKQGVINREELH